MKRKFSDIGFIKATGILGQTPRALKYIVENRDYIVPYSNLAEMAQNIRLILKTPMAEFFDRIIESRGLGNFIPLYLADAGGVPEILAQTLITLDVKQLDTNNLLASVPEARNKMIANVSSLIKRDIKTGRFVVTSVDNFLALFVKNYLVASYNDSDGWLSPYLGEFTVRTYSMVMSSLLARYFNLSIPETMQVMGVFALFQAQMLGEDDDDPIFPIRFRKCTYIGNNSELHHIAEICSKYSENGLNLDTLCECIKEVTPERLRSFSSRALLSLAGNLGSDAITTHIALEYPPYWVYILLLALSGNKIPIVYQLNAMKLAQEGRSKFLQQIMCYDELFTLNRG